MSKFNAIQKTAVEMPIDIPSIKNRIVALRALDRELVAAKTKLEGGGLEQQTSIQPADVRKLLAEFGDLVDPQTDVDGGELTLGRVQRDRDAIGRAIDILQDHLMIGIQQRAERELQRRGDEWHELTRETAMAICQLQKLNRAREALAKEIRGAAQLRLPGEFPWGKLGGLGYSSPSPGAAVQGFSDFLTLVMRLGIVTEGEIARARGDTPELYVGM